MMSCDDFLEVGPNTSELDTELIFENSTVISLHYVIESMEGVNL